MVAVQEHSNVLRRPIRLHDAMITTRALDALIELGVLDELAGGPRSSADLARTLGLERRPLELALDVLMTAGVTAAGDDGRWTLPDPQAARMVIGPGAIGDLLRGDGPTRDVSDREQSDALYGSVVERIARISAPVTAELLPELRRPGQAVLEVAAGASPWGRALCEDDAETAVTVVELPGVIDVTRSAVTRAGFAERYDFVAADVFDLDLPGTFDLVLVAGFCRLVGPDRNESLFRRAATWCAPGGRIAVIDAVSTAETRAAGLSSYELGLLTRTSSGRCWTFDRYARWLTDTGFGAVDLVTTSLPEISLVTAQNRNTDAIADLHHPGRDRV